MGYLGQLDTSRHAIDALARASSHDALNTLSDFKPTQSQRDKIAVEATELVRKIREDRRPGLMEVFLSEYGLSTDEGVALMCLAEALLRVPDVETMDALIEDKIAPSAWSEHLGQSSSPLVNASTWGLMLTGKVLGKDVDRQTPRRLRAMVKRLGEPVIRMAVTRAMKEMGRQFVLGQTIKEAISRRESGYRYSFDMLGEAAISTPDAHKYLTAYQAAISGLAPYCNSASVHDNPGISVKLSALHPRFDVLQKERVMNELLPRMIGLAEQAASHGMGLNIDAEEADRLDITLDIFERLAHHAPLKNWEGLGLVVQGYGKRAGAVIDWLETLSKTTGRRFMVRLVKGAYWDTEIKLAQELGVEGFPVYTSKAETDQSFAMCAAKLLALRPHIYPQFATHNAVTAATILELAGEDKTGFEFQRLHGMGEALHDILRKETGLPCRIYAPVGMHRDLLAYLVRRLLENGANSSFVSQITDEDVPIAQIVKDPFEADISRGVTLPTDLFGTRQNSRGFDLRDPEDMDEYLTGRAPYATQQWRVKPRIAKRHKNSGSTHKVINPAVPTDIVGEVQFADTATVSAAISAAKPWAASASDRAAILRQASHDLESRFGELFAVLHREAGKVAQDAIGELREAVDFLRFYADEAEANGDGTEPCGIFTTIAPWNFPLAIFLGQIGAALAAGNAVLAKPAESTCIVADLAVDVLHKAGVPKSALQCLPGEGSIVGAMLTSDPRISGVCFTGSTATAMTIHKSVAANLTPSAPLIAETGGINAMIVDSTALPQQAIGDIISSAFQSAGQRCSALRLLYLQDDIAEGFLQQLQDAMEELALGDPWDISTDIGPVIDARAQEDFANYLAQAKNDGRLLASMATPKDGHFIGPSIIRVANRAEVTREIFGPVLHVAIFEPENLDEVVADLNAADYSLTFGLHSRIDNRVEYITQSVEVGNIYINRNQIGAIVGSQPFGGSGLSGTGPKAGGPHYLDRFYKKPTYTESAPKEGAALAFAAAQAVIDAAPKVGENALTTIDCPGPTGESNRLSTFAKGRVLCLGRDAHKQAAIVESFGCVPVIFEGHLARHLLTDLTGFAAVALWSDPADQREARIALAKRDGPILALICGEDMSFACLEERHICVDMTASGGNAQLLAESA
ncbi:bifunctional proline dehydrogenase/L-glutamate gamma-semialdehyde dehydrogenase PutA [Litorimonas sp. RW-G-Af-16]|uniref:bifunctional proline dehydrogenase/L-glutamate gamma-semialdehyde dehydrogenase PutA n=1 Tax=Litorimonas sp. RW-G-Af-16 TaxID=3241168 RepID=UPI00390CB09B